MSNDFLPQEYDVPVSASGYMKLQNGENRFRILSKPIIGWLDWKDKKPLRFRINEKPAKPVDPEKKIKHFWAFVVWDYADSKLKILEITQSTIQSAIQALSKDADWGTPFAYDIKIIRTGDNLETKYAVNPVPHKSAPAEAKEAYLSTPVDLEALFAGEDPFDTDKHPEPIDDLPF